MFLWRIMIETGFEIEPVELWQDEIAFGRMQIAGRRITPQCPFRFPCLLPSRQRESKFEEPGKGPNVHWLIRDNASVVDRVVWRRNRLFIRLEQRQSDQRCAFKSPKWIRLICPIEIPKCTSIAVEMMLGLDVITDHAIDGIGRQRLSGDGLLGDFGTHRNDAGSLQSHRKESKRSSLSCYS